MSGSCMVPRDHLLDLLDDLRESLPEDVQAAGAIVEQRTEILQQAQAEAERLTGAHPQRERAAARPRRAASATSCSAPPAGSATSCSPRPRPTPSELLADAEAEAERLVAEAPDRGRCRRRRAGQLIAAGARRARAADHRDRGLPGRGLPRRRARRPDRRRRRPHARGGRRVRRQPARRLRDDARADAALGGEGPHQPPRALSPSLARPVGAAAAIG